MCLLEICSCFPTLWESVAIYRCCIKECNIVELRVLVLRCLRTFDLLMFSPSLGLIQITAKLPAEQDTEKQGLRTISLLTCILVLAHSLIHSFIYSLIKYLLQCASANERDTKKNDTIAMSRRLQFSLIRN